ncbi:MAG: putative DNA binding domain-containing protein [Candidatus Methanoplasma sp.]|jgi:predicted HTH transcriptional regulator|nr:putative DNA binding domain-containing protein [Candidatus Methanoplasma sp.]
MPKTLKEEIEAGEGNRLEFNSAAPSDSEKFVKTVVAFSNTAGGKIIFGVGDDKEIIGVPDTDMLAVKDGIACAIFSKCRPTPYADIYTETVDGKTLIVVEVVEGPGRPYHIDTEGIGNGTYIRFGATTRKAPPEIVTDLRRAGRNQTFDAEPCIDYTVNDDKISALCTVLSSYGKRTFKDADLLNMRALIQSGNGLKASNAFALLSEDNPFLNARISCGTFKGSERGRPIDRKEFTGSIIRQSEEAYAYVLQHIDVGMELRGAVREDVYEIPEDVIRESIMNAAVHRDYGAGRGAVSISVYDDRVEITSPGPLPWGMDIDKAKQGRSKPRNDVIAVIFKSAGMAEGFGTGIKMMFDECIKVGLPEPTIVDDGDVTVTLRRPQSAERRMPTTEHNMNPSEKEITDMLKDSGGMTTKDIKAASSLRPDQVKHALSSLSKKNIISKVGGNNGLWKIVR